MRAAADFRSLTILYSFFVVALALVLAYVAAVEDGCDEFGCGRELDGWRFVGTTLAVLGVGVLLILPLRAMTVLLMGVARLLTEVEADRS